MDWSSGYVSDVNYTHGYYPGLNPLNLNLALTYAGIKPPLIKKACELGFGQGISINFHAADKSIIGLVMTLIPLMLILQGN